MSVQDQGYSCQFQLSYTWLVQTKIQVYESIIEQILTNRIHLLGRICLPRLGVIDQKKPIPVLAKTRDRQIIWNAGTIPCDNQMLDMCERLYLSQKRLLPPRFFELA